MTIHTASRLRARARKLDRKNLSVAAVLAAMRGGKTLQLQLTHLGATGRIYPMANASTMSLQK